MADAPVSRSTFATTPCPALPPGRPCSPAPAPVPRTRPASTRCSSPSTSCSAASSATTRAPRRRRRRRRKAADRTGRTVARSVDGPRCRRGCHDARTARDEILLAALRTPVVLAKTVATLDVLSGGHVDLGVGVGWQRAEYEPAGLSFADRGARLGHVLEVCPARAPSPQAGTPRLIPWSRDTSSTVPPRRTMRAVIARAPRSTHAESLSCIASACSMTSGDRVSPSGTGSTTASAQRSRASRSSRLSTSCWIGGRACVANRTSRWGSGQELQGAKVPPSPRQRRSTVATGSRVD